MKITQKVAFYNIASEASYVYISLKMPKILKNSNATFWVIFKQCDKYLLCCRWPSKTWTHPSITTNEISRVGMGGWRTIRTINIVKIRHFTKDKHDFKTSTSKHTFKKILTLQNPNWNLHFRSIVLIKWSTCATFF